MKRHSHLWEGLVSFRNLTQAAHKAARGKRGNPSVQRFLFHLETELCRIEDQLRAQVWVPGEYRTFEVHEPKRRMISAAPFRDRVVHHALTCPCSAARRIHLNASRSFCGTACPA